jgi:hypothetical protein
LARIFGARAVERVLGQYANGKLTVNIAAPPERVRRMTDDPFYALVDTQTSRPATGTPERKYAA